MAIYFTRDLSVATNGDITVDERGALELNSAAESVKQVVKTLIATDYGEFGTSIRLGANLGSLIGTSDMKRVLSRIPPLVNDALKYAGTVDASDVLVKAYAISEDIAAVFVDIRGTFLDVNGEVETFQGLTIKYIFPYLSDRIEEL